MSPGLACSIPALFADAAAPPTFVIDALHLGRFLGPIVGLALAAAAITAFFWLRKRIHTGCGAAVICFLVYAAVNFAIYLYALNAAFEERRLHPERWGPRPPPTTKPEPEGTGRSSPRPTSPNSAASD